MPVSYQNRHNGVLKLVTIKLFFISFLCLFTSFTVAEESQPISSTIIMLNDSIIMPDNTIVKRLNIEKEIVGASFDSLGLIFQDNEKEKFEPNSNLATKLLIIDKNANRKLPYVVNPEKKLFYESLTISATHCVANYKQIEGNDIAYVEVIGGMDELFFSGWMYKSFPAASTLEHPIIDVRVDGCTIIGELNQQTPASDIIPSVLMEDSSR